MYNYTQSCLIIDKPSGISSNEVLTKVKKKLNQKKAGFSGTLDPLASGLLIIFFNKATKLCSYFLNADKSYEAIAKLGQISNTGDSDGEILATNNIPDLNTINLKNLEKKYTGIINQIPPMHSALKYKGIRLYKYARDGINIERQPREIKIYNIKLNIIDEEHISIKVKCSKGTYIRTLIEQLGEDIGCGALVSKLVRTHINDICLSRSVNLDNFLNSSEKDICDKYIINVDEMLYNTNSCYLSEINKSKVLNGNKVIIDEKAIEIVRIYDENKRFIGIGKVNDNNELLPKKILI